MITRTLSTLIVAAAIASPALAANTASIPADTDKGAISEVSSKGSTSSIWMPFDRGESRDR